MTGSRRALMGKGPSECPCGSPSQTFEQLLWHCHLVPPPAHEFEHVRDLPTWQSTAHLLPEGADSRDISIWKLSLTRAVKIMGMQKLSQVPPGRCKREGLERSLPTYYEGMALMCSVPSVASLRDPVTESEFWLDHVCTRRGHHDLFKKNSCMVHTGSYLRWRDGGIQLYVLLLDAYGVESQHGQPQA